MVKKKSNSKKINCLKLQGEKKLHGENQTLKTHWKKLLKKIHGKKIVKINFKRGRSNFDTSGWIK